MTPDPDPYSVAESARKLAETARVTAEQARVEAESVRESAEALQTETHEAREEARTARKEAKVARAQAERSRSLARTVIIYGSVVAVIAVAIAIGTLLMGKSTENSIHDAQLAACARVQGLRARINYNSARIFVLLTVEGHESGPGHSDTDLGGIYYQPLVDCHKAVDQGTHYQLPKSELFTPSLARVILSRKLR